MEEAFKAEVERSKAELEEVFKAEVEKLRTDLDTERKRAQLAEENLAIASAAVEENIAEVNNFIANGVRLSTVCL